MKIKLFTLTAIVVGILTIGSANAETCENGSTITGENGHVYCGSWNAMNWWTAYTWCQGQGRHLASMYEVCPTWDGSSIICNVNNAISSDVYYWTSTAYGTDTAFHFDRRNSYTSKYTRNATLRAFCY